MADWKEHGERPRPSAPFTRLCAVVVLYRQAPAESVTICSLQKILRNHPEFASRFFLCVYDNSPHPASLPRDLVACEWVGFAPRSNNGLAQAYNIALDIARQGAIEWLLLLDSDTEVTPEFLGACFETIRAVETDPQVGALVPHIVENGTTHSPRLRNGWRRRAVAPDFAGKIDAEIIALNSGAVLRVSALASIGGFNRDFWLDYLDYWVFRSLQRKGYRVFVLREAIAHCLSFADAAARMPESRYRNMLAAERYFTAAFGSFGEQVRLKAVLLKRALLFAVRDRSITFACMTLHELFRVRGAKRPPARFDMPQRSK